jgi:hypothetical protein
MRQLAALSLLLAGCAAQPPPVQEKVEAPAPVAAPVVQRGPRQVISTTWKFDATTDECVAVAVSGRTSLQVTVPRNAPIRMTVSLARSLPSGRPIPMALRFNGPAGRWQVNARPVGTRQLAAALGSDDTALSRVLVLLSGGVLEVGEPDAAIPSLGLTPSEARGRVWFDCARRNMT